MSTAIRTEKKRKTALTPQVPDFCPACDAVDHPFLHTQKKATQEFRGETFTVDATSMCCKHCGFEVAMPGSLDALRLATMDAYRKEHGLLTSTQITELRQMMGMSQRDFAEYVGVGVASLQRWEKGLVVQDKASDELIRLRTQHAQYISITVELTGKSKVSKGYTCFVIHFDSDVQRFVAKGATRVRPEEIKDWRNVPKSAGKTIKWRTHDDAAREDRHSTQRWNCAELKDLLATTG